MSVQRLSIGFLLVLSLPLGAGETVSWKSALSMPEQWYSSDEAVRIAKNVLFYQRSSGGWTKNIDMAATLDKKALRELERQKSRRDSSFDNGATYTQLRFLARVHRATGKFERGFHRGLDFVLKAQYDNGGWPQTYPDVGGYHGHITFNDGAMVGVLRLLRDVRDEVEPFKFVSKAKRRACRIAFSRGIECILNCQVKSGGVLTAWCAQHDRKNFRPRDARSYEKASLSGSEGAGVLELLMEIEDPSPRVMASVQAAVAWFDGPAKLKGIRIERKPVVEGEGTDKVVVIDHEAPALWARFYELSTFRPFFCSRDGVSRYALEEISHERRNGYSWYTSRPRAVLAKYEAWRVRVGVVTEPKQAVTKAGLVLCFSDASASLRKREVREEQSAEFEDAFTHEWVEALPLLKKHGARATFFVANFDRLSTKQIEHLRELRRAGHAIASRGLRGIDPESYVTRFSIAKYFAEEVLPALQGMRRAGLNPIAFGVPKEPSAEIRKLLLRYVDVIYIMNDKDARTHVVPVADWKQGSLGSRLIKGSTAKSVDALGEQLKVVKDKKAIVHWHSGNISASEKGLALSPEALDAILEEAAEQGLRFYLLDEAPSR